MKKSVLLVFAGVLLAAPIMAADDAPPATKPTAQPPVAAERAETSDKPVCKKLPPPLGTRLGPRNVCHTERQWRELELDSQKALKNVQDHANGSPGGN